MSVAKSRLTAKELELEGVGLQVQASGAVGGAMTTGIDTALVEDLCGDLLKVGRTRGARKWLAGAPLSSSWSSSTGLYGTLMTERMPK